ncbi:MAG: hypothetical protein IJ880_15075 [Bacilli bacterium]|nr:hypothetical protein [Bacilli bacterium]
MTTIIDSNIVEQSNQDMKAYAIEVFSNRALPFIDGLKPIHRKVLYCLFHDFPQTRNQNTVKSASMVGTVLYKYSPHGDSSTYEAGAALSNWFQNYMPLIKGQGGLGNIKRGVKGASAYRYTEMALSKFSMDAIFDDMLQTNNCVDWMPNYSYELEEPKYLPVKVPLLLINGTFSIAVGFGSNIPSHNINEVIDATIKLIDNPNAKIVLVPDDCQGSDIIAADFERISETGTGKFRTRAKIEVSESKGQPVLTVTTLPNMTTFDAIREKIEKLKENNVLPQIKDVYHQSSVDINTGKDIFKAEIILKKGSDPEFVKNVLYKSTDLEKTTSVSFRLFFNDLPVIMNYKQYLLNFIEFRKQIKMRLFASRLKDNKTKMHKLWLYIYVLESGKVNDVIKLIRKQGSVELEDLVKAMMKLLPKTTPLQCKELLKTQLYKLSKGNLIKYKAEYNMLEKEVEDDFNKSVHGEGINEIIKAELLEIKKKYGFARKSKIISLEEANNIPKGIFRIVVTKKGFIKKLDQSDKFFGLRDDSVEYSALVDNIDNLLLFGKLGKVYSLPVSKIPFVNKGSNGTDLRYLIKKYVGEGICVIIPESDIKELDRMSKEDMVECNFFILTKEGLFKRIKINELFNIPISGLMYTKLNPTDEVINIMPMNPYNDIILYNRNRVLKLNGSSAPLLNRSTKGNIGISTNTHPASGMVNTYPEDEFIVIITQNGYVNKINSSSIDFGKRGQAGTPIIKMGKSDDVFRVFSCVNDDIIQIYTKRGEKQLCVKDIKTGTSISNGEKLIDSSGIVYATLIMK